MLNAPVQDLLTKFPHWGKIKKQFSEGLSHSAVYHLQSESGKDVVLKIQKDMYEYDFFTVLRPRYLSQKTWLPQVYDYGCYKGWNWLLMEFVPQALPKERFNKDKQALKILKELHSVDIDLAVTSSESTLWLSEQLSVASRYLTPHAMRHVERWQTQCNMLLNSASTEHKLCAYDSNPFNWLIRNNGDLVLIDWQLVSTAPPALDIAGWISTMVDFETITDISKMYLATESREHIDAFSKDVALFLCRRFILNFWRYECSSCKEAWEPSIQHSRETLPSWIESLAKSIDI